MGPVSPGQYRMLGRSQRWAAILLLAAMSSSAVLAQQAQAPEKAEGAASLEKAFADPPAAARPRVWWHWLNGNVSKDGIRKDLEWMKRTGIGGVQTFDASLQTPQIVDKRLAYMSPEWKDAFRFAASEADRLGLEMAIAASPGWSETGGPWVRPEDGMKKIAWSETIVEGGRRFYGTLAKPSATSGPFQDAPMRSLLAALVGEKIIPDFYRDTAVFAYRLPNRPMKLAARASLNGKPLDGALLSDGSFASGLSLPKGTTAEPTIVDLTLDRPETVRSITFFLRDGFQVYQPGIVVPRLEVSDDGSEWRRIAVMLPSSAPTTVSFPAITTKYFRVVMSIHGSADAPDPNAAPGFDKAAFDIFKTEPVIDLVEARLSSEARIDHWEGKAGFSAFSKSSTNAVVPDASEAGVAASDVIDLTHRVGADGTLDWNAPRGTWRVVRMGWSLTGTTNHPAAPEATGLEVDKLDSAAVRRYLETYLDTYRDAAGPELLGQRGVQALLTDSTEVGSFNWTPALLERFRELRGYDARPWLPALTGAIVETRERSDEFLYDFRRTLGELHTSEHYKTVAEVAHAHGLKVYGESLEGSGGSPGDDLDMRRYADIPMGAQWTFARGEKPPTHNEADMRGAASVAHFYGQKLVAAESLTSVSNPWASAPSDLRRTIDLIFASGVNRPVIHTSVHVPRDDRQPGLSLWNYGQYFNRMETWSEMAGPWIDYIARSSLMLQQGSAVADVAYFYGEDGPIGAMSEKGLPADLPGRYAYDFVSPKAVREELKVDKGDLVAPSGLRYRVLQLGGTSERMTFATLKRIAALAESGATIVGDAPKRQAGLAGDTPEFNALAARLWAGGEETRVGQGRVIAGRDVEKALARIGVAPDFAVASAGSDARLMFVHRRMADGDIYFVSNRDNQARKVDIRFRVAGKAPQIWHAETASIRPASYRIEGEQTIVPLDLAGEQSLFVVFRTDTSLASRTVATENLRTIGEVQGPWKVDFQPGRGAPASATLAQLGSLSENPDPGIKYFSGVATYRRSIDAPRSHKAGKPLWLDLGAIGDVAEVRVNGKLAGTAWLAPYRVDIGPFVKPGRNMIDIRVANLWVNRLIGDAQPGARPITYTPEKTYMADAPLRASGLIGPVRLLGTE